MMTMTIRGWTIICIRRRQPLFWAQPRAPRHVKVAKNPHADYDEVGEDEEVMMIEIMVVHFSLVVHDNTIDGGDGTTL